MQTSDLPATLAGGVHGAHDARPALQHVAVRLIGAETDTARVTYTDSAGTFRFDGLAAGRYTLEFRRIGYETRRLAALSVDPTRGTRVVVPLQRYLLCERWDLQAPRSPSAGRTEPAQRAPARPT
ncbi:carboxypeptidase-like regulatory domain-containing protein [Roseisolibacter agri]|uniref:Carboxypeptidase regulatory-like domain-containing protein n=1 Tax=Roseisolibacter agri TaxID=2014610 RepID=A0AA37V231_9BACT|nr:carboxypeptidase-like regulatory domain-containing protein [Roseisolibacter agri]GLC24642.1 hypothetical protein rosag_11550 [Roseisolibacter agri]